MLNFFELDPLHVLLIGFFALPSLVRIVDDKIVCTTWASGGEKAIESILNQSYVNFEFFEEYDRKMKKRYKQKAQSTDVG